MGLDFANPFFVYLCFCAGRRLSRDYEDLFCDFIIQQTVTQDLAAAIAKAQTAVNIKNMEEMQRINAENMEETMRSKREVLWVPLQCTKMRNCAKMFNTML